MSSDPKNSNVTNNGQALTPEELAQYNKSVAKSTKKMMQKLESDGFIRPSELEREKELQDFLNKGESLGPEKSLHKRDIEADRAGHMHKAYNTSFSLDQQESTDEDSFSPDSAHSTPDSHSPPSPSSPRK